MAGFIGLYSLYVSAKPKDYDHPYGHGKVEFISAAIEGTLISVAGCFIVYEALMNLLHPSPVKKLDWGILLVSISALINYLVGSFCVKTGKKNNSLALIASGNHLRSDTYSTIGLPFLVVFFIKWLPKFPDGIFGLKYNPEIGVGYVFIANLVQSIVTLAIVGKEFVNFSIKKFDFQLWKRIMNYSWPVMIAGLAGIVNQTLDRQFLKYLLSDK